MLRLGARRGRQQPSLTRSLIGQLRRPSGTPIPGAIPHAIGQQRAANSLQEATRTGGNCTSLAGFYELVKVRRASRVPESSDRGNGIYESFVEARLGGRRNISSSRKSDVKVETAALPAAPVSKLNFVAWYVRKLHERPLLTKSLTAGAIYASSDLCSQGLSAIAAEEGEPVAWDAARSARMLAVGLIMSGPLLHLWFGSVAKLYPNRDIASTLKKLVLGQLFYGPAFCTAFFTINAYAQGENTSQISLRLQRDLIPTLQRGLLYWPACDFVTYRFIPLHLQPFVSNCFSFVWTIYLTYMAGKKTAGNLPMRVDQ